MDATTHVHVADTDAAPHTLSLDVICQASGEHLIAVAIFEKNKRRGSIIFDPKEWANFKGSVLAVDRAVQQLRDKGLIFSFGPVLSEPEIPDPKHPGEYRVRFLAEKVTAKGKEEREFSDLAEMSRWIHAAV